MHVKYGADAADRPLDHAHVPDRRRRAPTSASDATRRSATATAAGPRSSSASTPTRPTPQASRHWTMDYWEALHPSSAGGAYVNFMMDEGQERVQAAYRANYDRLAQVKARYDPDNLFRVNQNIEPA